MPTNLRSCLTSSVLFEYAEIPRGLKFVTDTEGLGPNFAHLGPRQKINAQDRAVFWFVYKAHPPVHISGYVPVDATQ
jgi:hypothetical protein